MFRNTVAKGTLFVNTALCTSIHVSAQGVLTTGAVYMNADLETDKTTSFASEIDTCTLASLVSYKMVFIHKSRNKCQSRTMVDGEVLD